MFKINIAPFDLAQDPEAVALLFLYAADKGDYEASQTAIRAIEGWTDCIDALPYGAAVRAREGNVTLSINGSFISDHFAGERIGQFLSLVRETASFQLPVVRHLISAHELRHYTMTLTTSEAGHSTLLLEEFRNSTVTACEIFSDLNFEGIWETFSEFDFYSATSYFNS